MDKVLVAYVTRYGSTQEVAEAVAAVLREKGLDAEVQPMRGVRSLDGYGAVVLGAPLYIGSMPKDAPRFLEKHREALLKRPVALFVLGPTGGTPDSPEWQGVREQLDEALARFPWLTLAARELFGGRYDPAKLRFPDSLLATLPVSPLRGAPASDVRDWTAIRAWAAQVADRLRA